MCSVKAESDLNRRWRAYCFHTMWRLWHSYIGLCVEMPDVFMDEDFYDINHSLNGKYAWKNNFYTVLGD
jgi:hypothetical protein